MDNLETGFYCLIVSLVWGATNPLIKNSTKDITKVEANNLVQRFLNEIKYLVANWNVDLSLIVPLINALTFVITGLVGFLIGENSPSIRTLFGTILILSGITFCILDKYHSDTVEK